MWLFSGLLGRATGEATRARLTVEFARARVVELEAAVMQVEDLIKPPRPDPELIEGEAA